MVTSSFLRIFAASALFAFCNANSIVDRFTRCAVRDNACLTTLYNIIFKELAENGLPEFGLPVADPYAIKNVEITALGLFKVTLNEGVAKGFKTCSVKDFVPSTVANLKVVNIQVTCDKIEVEGKYSLTTTPAIEALLGKIDIHGNGNAKIVVEKLLLNIDMAFEIKKAEDGELYFVLIADDTTYTYRVLGDIAIESDNLFVGTQDISAVASKILSENKEFSVNTFGRTIGDKVLEILFQDFGKFFTKVPANKIATDDLTSYVN